MLGLYCPVSQFLRRTVRFNRLPEIHFLLTNRTLKLEFHSGVETTTFKSFCSTSITFLPGANLVRFETRSICVSTAMVGQLNTAVSQLTGPIILL